MEPVDSGGEVGALAEVLQQGTAGLDTGAQGRPGGHDRREGAVVAREVQVAPRGTPERRIPEAPAEDRRVHRYPRDVGPERLQIESKHRPEIIPVARQELVVGRLEERT